jgi:hypothetical protein
MLRPAHEQDKAGCGLRSLDDAARIHRGSTLM